ncbi:MAG: hypothetical protein HFJ46_00640 [Clostridia bacterium]|nr:hypothetical protein [Clostridia bacterium]
MKKNAIIILLTIVIIILICFCLILKNKDIQNTVTFYQTAIKFDEIENCPALQVGNLQVKLTNFYLNGNVPSEMTNVSENEKDENNCVQRLTFSTTNAKNIQILIYDYIVYDNNGNILATNIYGPKEDNSNKQMSDFKKYFNKTVFKSTDNKEYMDRILGGSFTSRVYDAEIENSNEAIMHIVGNRSGEKKYEDNFNEIHVLIVNPRYQEEGNSEFFEFENTVLEFILKK